ncbi:197_t:CDS:2, partial [Racocetra fulgida]
HYLVLEYAELGDLRYYLNHSNLDWDKKVDIARQVVCGLFFLHENEILHRDLHTKNVVIKNDESDESDESFKYGIRVTITDFGLSKVIPRNSTSNQLIGDEWQQPIELQQNELNESVYDEDNDIDITYDENLIQTELPQILISETESSEVCSFALEKTPSNSLIPDLIILINLQIFKSMHDNLVDKRKLNRQDEQLDEQLIDSRNRQREDDRDKQREDESNSDQVINEMLEKFKQLMLEQFSSKELEMMKRLSTNKPDLLVLLLTNNKNTTG